MHATIRGNRSTPARPCFCRASTLLLCIFFSLLGLFALGNLSVWQRRACDERVAAAERAAAEGALAMVGRPGGAGVAVGDATASADELRRLRAQVAYLTSDAGARSRVVHAQPGAPAAPVTAHHAPSVGAPAGAAIEPATDAPKLARAVVVFCYNRPEYLRRTLRTMLARLPRHNRPHVYVSQDGDDAGVAGVIAEAAAEWAAAAPDVPFTHWRHVNKAGSLRGTAIPSWATSYYALAQHFGWALGRLFTERAHPHVIILEDDLEIAPDFFDYFSATEPILDADETLLGVSAYNDLGQAHLVDDPRAVYRSDFFPGLGWMLNAHAWEELGPKWPEAFWDDWLREPPQRKGRHFLRPEVSRTMTFGEKGVSAGQFSQFLSSVKLNDVAVDWAKEDLTYLAPAVWDADIAEAVKDASRAASLAEFFDQTCTPASDSRTVKFGYDGQSEYSPIANRFGYLDDEKAGVPRTAYKGIVHFPHAGCLKFIVPVALL